MKILKTLVRTPPTYLEVVQRRLDEAKIHLLDAESYLERAIAEAEMRRNRVKRLRDELFIGTER